MSMVNYLNFFLNVFINPNDPKIYFDWTPLCFNNEGFSFVSFYKLVQHDLKQSTTQNVSRVQIFITYQVL